MCELPILSDSHCSLDSIDWRLSTSLSKPAISSPQKYDSQSNLQVFLRDSVIPFFVGVVIEIKFVVRLQRYIGRSLVIVLKTINWNQFYSVCHSRDRDHHRLMVKATIRPMEDFASYLVHLHHIVRTTEHLKQYDEK